MPARIRSATSRDREGIRDVYLRAFHEDENQLVAGLAVNLLIEETSPETIGLVAEVGGGIVGHIAFSPLTAVADGNWLGYILAPLGVRPEHHKAGIGSKLVESGIERLWGTRASAVLVYGDPRYYGRFGFTSDAASRFIPPYELKQPLGWQARVLRNGGSDRRAVKLSCVSSLRDPALW